MKAKTKPKITFIRKNTIEHMCYKELKEAGLIKEVRVMYHNVREDVLDYCEKYGVTMDEAKEIIAEEYHLSPASIHGILYKPMRDQR
jgi:septation ring formation regulator EzrA